MTFLESSGFASIFTISPMYGFLIPENTRIGSLIEYLCLFRTNALNERMGRAFFTLGIFPLGGGWRVGGSWSF